MDQKLERKTQQKYASITQWNGLSRRSLPRSSTLKTVAPTAPIPSSLLIVPSPGNTTMSCQGTANTNSHTKKCAITSAAPIPDQAQIRLGRKRQRVLLQVCERHPAARAGKSCRDSVG